MRTSTHAAVMRRSARRSHRAATFLALGALLAIAPACSLLRLGHSSDYTASPFFDAPPAVWKQAHTVRVVTYNIKDLYVLSEHRHARMAGLATALAAAKPDLVCLQEGFVADDVERLTTALHDLGLVHTVDFPSGVLGSGLWTLSRFPIRETYFLRFSKNGAMTDTNGGDWWAGKGVGLARVEVAPGELLDVYNTHMICGLGGEELVAHRRVQVREYAGFATGATPHTVPALLVGDFNCGYGRAGTDGDFLHYVMRWEPMLQRRYGYDHIFARSHGGSYRFTATGEVAFSGHATVGDPPLPVSLSDHNGLLAEVRIEPPPPTTR